MDFIRIPYLSEYDVILPRKRTNENILVLEHVICELKTLETLPKKVLSLKYKDYPENKTIEIFKKDGHFYQETDITLEDILNIFNNENNINNEDYQITEKRNRILKELGFPAFYKGHKKIEDELPKVRQLITSNKEQITEKMQKYANKSFNEHCFIFDGKLYNKTFMPKCEEAFIRSNNVNNIHNMGIRILLCGSDINGNIYINNRNKSDKTYNIYPLEYATAILEKGKQFNTERFNNERYPALAEIGMISCSNNAFTNDVELHINDFSLENILLSQDNLMNLLNDLPVADDKWNLENYSSSLLLKYAEYLHTIEEWKKNPDISKVEYIKNSILKFKEAIVEHNEKRYTPHYYDTLSRHYNMIQNHQNLYEKTMENFKNQSLFTSLKAIEDSKTTLDFNKNNVEYHDNDTIDKESVSIPTM
jgi:hypothetical protein